MLNPLISAEFIAASAPSSPELQALLAARKLYGRVSLHGLVRSIWAALQGRSSHLPVLAEVAPDAFPASGQVAQVMQVTIRQIVGSEDRAHDFDAQFAPLQAHTRQRWINVAVAWYSCQPLPPVQLIAVSDAYYVRDGHHRVSVARAFGAHTIEAEVLVWQTARVAMAPEAMSAALQSHS